MPLGPRIPRFRRFPGRGLVMESNCLAQSAGSSRNGVCSAIKFADLSLFHEAVVKAKLIYPSWKGFQCIDGIGPNDQILPFDLNGVNVTVGTQSSAIGIQGVALARKVVDIGNMGPLRQVDIPKRYFQTAADGPLEVLNAQQVVSLFNEQTMRFDPIRQVGSPAKEPIALRGCLSWQAIHMQGVKRSSRAGGVMTVT